MKFLFLISFALLFSQLRADSLKCYRCTTLTNENCKDGPYDDFEMTCNGKCYVLKYSGVVDRGCATAEAIATCEAMDNEYCNLCSSNLCNSGIVISGTFVLTSLLGLALYFIM